MVLGFKWDVYADTYMDLQFRSQVTPLVYDPENIVLPNNLTNALKFQKYTQKICQ